MTKMSGYLTLQEAEKVYAVKSDTLRKRCQKGKIRGAIKKGKTWFVPSIPGVDPEAEIGENYPDLNFKASMTSNCFLYDAEAESRQILYSQNSNYIFIWEYGFYYLSLFIQESSLAKSYLPLAALYTEALSSLRSSFLLNLYGYHADSMALLRKTQETAIKLAAIKKTPKKIWSIIMSSSIQKAEDICGVSFKEITRLTSSFVHGNQLKSLQAGRDLEGSSDVLSVAYGPQIDNSSFKAYASISIFWMYFLMSVLPIVFERQAGNRWLDLNSHSLKLMQDYLQSTGSGLAKDTDQINNLVTEYTTSKKWRQNKIKKQPNRIC